MTRGASWVEHIWRSRDGLNLHARVYGDDRAKLPVVCIPGLTRNARDFEDVAPWIASQGRKVLAVDLRGRGQSDRDPNPRRYQPRVYAQDMAALLRSIGAKKAIFVGTSLGGVVIMALAASRPNILGGAVMNDVGPEVAKEGLARIQSYAGASAPVISWDEAAAYAKRINGAAFPDAPEEEWPVVARRLFREEGGRPVLDYDPLIFRAPHPLAVWLARPLLWSAFRRLAARRPLLLVHGAITDILDTKTIARMKLAAPHMDVAAVPRVGHAPSLMEPAAREAMAAFFQRAP